jgi:Periplasmic copper-binding protein (NosD)
MRHAVPRSLVAGAIGAAAVLPWIAAGPALATTAAASATTFVAPAGSPKAADHSCASAAYSSVQAAVNATRAGGTVIVCRGTYRQSVTVSTQLRLVGRPGATIDAAGQHYGVGVAASNVTVTGLTVENASVGGTLADGIVTAGLVGGKMVAGNHVTIVDNTVKDNAGSGIDINSTSYSSAFDNRSTGNAVGLNVSDDFGLPAAHNVLIGNTANRNPGGCGIALADHTGKGIFGNLVAFNASNDNGLGSPSAENASSGSGVILAGSTGGVYNNTIVGNTLDGNGHAGFDIHAHAPGLKFTNNSVIGNRIGVNNLRTSVGDLLTTGIYLGDASPLSITVHGNVISGDHFGIFTAGGPVTVHLQHQNVYRHVTSDLGSTPTF